MIHTQRRLDQLTSTRFLAAISVVLFHCVRNEGIFQYLPMLTSGPTAVSYFFVLSGFVLTITYYNPEQGLDLKKYFLARFSRIYPVYFFSFFLTCVFYLDNLARIKPEKVLANIFLIQAWIPRYAQSFNIAAWSLSVEAFFYIVFPLFLAIFSRLRVSSVIWTSLTFWGISQTAHLALTISTMPENAEVLAYFPIFHLNAFIIGMSGGIWYMTRQQDEISAFNQKSLLLWLGAFLVVMALLTLRGFMPGFSTNFSLDVGLLAPLFLFIVLGLVGDYSLISEIFKRPWLVHLGEASYALYILHIPLRWLMEKIFEGYGWQITFSTLIWGYIPFTILISTIVYRFLEVPARSWLRQNPRQLVWMLADLILFYLICRLSFIIRLGNELVDYKWSQNLFIRAGVPILLLCLIIFQVYAKPSCLSITLAVGLSSVLLFVFMGFAWNLRWVEGFSRSILLLNTGTLIGWMITSRWIDRTLNKYSNIRMSK